MATDECGHPNQRSGDTRDFATHAVKGAITTLVPSTMTSTRLPSNADIAPLTADDAALQRLVGGMSTWGRRNRGVLGGVAVNRGRQNAAALLSRALLSFF